MIFCIIIIYYPASKPFLIDIYKNIHNKHIGLLSVEISVVHFSFPTIFSAYFDVDKKYFISKQR